MLLAGLFCLPLYNYGLTYAIQGNCFTDNLF
jgi:hypothetical protein